MKTAAGDRTLENSDYQVVARNQKQTQAILEKALAVLKKVYEKDEGYRALAQADQPASFKPYKKQGGSGGVLGMLKQIIADSRKVEAEASAAESDAQGAYEAFVKNTNGSIEQKTKEMVNKDQRK